MTHGASPSAAWLPPGKEAAVCFTIDDVHPGTSADAYEAGGDLGEGALGHVEWLLERHPQLEVTLFCTADWRELSPVPTRRLLARLPVLRDRRFLTPVLPKGTMRLDRHPDFVEYLRRMPRTEVALHGLHHVHPGARVAVEFQEQDRAECAAMLRTALDVFRHAGLDPAPGMTPPGRNATPALTAAMADVGLSFVASARDVVTPVGPGAVTAMSGLQGVSLIEPTLVADGRLVHITSNFQATSPIDRAIAIIEHHGLLAVKAHIVKNAFGYVQLDGVDELYRNYLDVTFTELERRYGDSLWWTSMSAVADRVQSGAPAPASQ